MSDEVRELAVRMAARLERMLVSLAKIEEEIEAMLGELTQQQAEPPDAPDAGAEGQEPPQEPRP
jgi:hypothetical protein